MNPKPDRGTSKNISRLERSVRVRAVHKQTACLACVTVFLSIPREEEGEEEGREKKRERESVCSP